MYYYRSASLDLATSTFLFLLPVFKTWNFMLHLVLLGWTLCAQKGVYIYKTLGNQLSRNLDVLWSSSFSGRLLCPVILNFRPAD